MKFVSWDYDLFQPTSSDGVHLHTESNQLMMQTGSAVEYISVLYASSSYNRGNTYWNVDSMPATHSSHPTISSGSISTFTQSTLSGNQNLIHIKVGDVNTMFLSSSSETLHSYKHDGLGTWARVDVKPHEVTTDHAFLRVNEDATSSDLFPVSAVSQSVQPDTNVKEWTFELSGNDSDVGIVVNKIAW